MNIIGSYKAAAIEQLLKDGFNRKAQEVQALLSKYRSTKAVKQHEH